MTGQLPVFSDNYNGNPDAYQTGEWFYLEVHGRNIIGWWGPLALGVVTVNAEGRGYLQSVVTVDGAREMGFAEMIVEEAGERWPGHFWHGCDASREFHSRLVAKGIAVKQKYADAYDFIPKNERTDQSLGN